MKKKLLMAVLPLCVALTMTACGKNADTAEVKDSSIAEENADADAQTEAETQMQAEAEPQELEETETQAWVEKTDEYYEAGRKSLYGLDGTQINLEDAYTNFIKSQELGNTDANFYLGLLAEYYDYPKLDYKQAKAYYEQCGDNPYAKIALGYLYYYGHGIDDDKQKATTLFWEAAAHVVEGYVGLATNSRDYETALKYYNKVVEEGTEQYYIAEAMVEISFFYESGRRGVERDWAKVVELRTKAVDLGNVRAMWTLGNMYETGIGVEKDGAKALELYSKIADLGDAFMLDHIGYMYYTGEVVEQDYDKAIEYYTKAADLGNVDAINNLGYMYSRGDGVEQDGEKAIEWYTKLMDLGDLDAMYRIADMYWYGEGVEQDYEKAIELYTKEADSGDSYGLVTIGNRYRYGFGVEQDGEKAIEYYTKAADLGDTSAKAALEDMQGQ